MNRGEPMTWQSTTRPLRHKPYGRAVLCRDATHLTVGAAGGHFDLRSSGG
jgi:hypothetical protein